jgi:Mce-associated membrane protein
VTSPDLATTRAEPGPGGARGSGVPGGRRLLLVLAVVTLLLAVAAVVLSLQLREQAETDDRRAAALAAARQSALNLTSIDTREFDEDVRKVLEGATGDFLADFQERTKDGELESVLVENQVVSEGTVIEAGLVRSDETNATALVVIDSTVQNTASPDGRVNTYRMQLELELRDGAWRTSTLEFVA